MTRRHCALVLLTTLVALVPIILILSLGTGPVSIRPAEIASILLHDSGLVDASPDDKLRLIIESIRLPRTLVGFMVGGALAVAGAAMQGLFRNPLADPSIIGVASGSALGASVSIVLGAIPFTMVAHGLLHNIEVPLMAFIGGITTTGLIYRIGTTGNGTSVTTMLLAGLAINALAGACIGFLSYIADDATLRSLTYWQMGSMDSATWDMVLICTVTLLPASLLLCRYAQVINVLLLGESEARHLGVNIQRVKFQLITLSALAVGVSVSVSGIISFVGLVVPHLIRLIVGPDHRILLPASTILGGLLLVCADMLSRTLIAPAELPIGIVTSLMGAPFFMVILWQQRQRIS
ncbi:MAG: iron ABC transporter permease [Endozoicomonas sp. (ex Botrylloides leachii)]|nr:iron ABC transporter permease [Endozoicomonas sp. (ex Botrylloides leachii)]